MAATDLISPVDPAGTYPTIPAGSNRLAFLTLCYQNGSGNVTAPPAPTIGGVTATFVCGDAEGVVRDRGTLSTYVILESQIPSMSGLAIVLNGSAPFKRATAWAVQGAKQAIPTRFGSQYITTGAASIPLARVANSWTFLGAFTAVAENITLTNPARTTRVQSVNIGYAADSLQTVNSTTQSKTYVQNVHVINIEPVPPQVITSTNGGNPVKNGSAFSSGVTGFTGVVSGTLGSKLLSGLSYSSNTILATAPNFVDGQTFYEPDTNQTLIYANGAETASAVVPTASPDGMASVVMVNPETVDATYLTEAIPGIANSDRIVFPTEGGYFSIGANGKITCRTAGARVLWWWKASNSMMTRLDVTINDAGAVVGVSRRLRGRRLTANRLIGKRLNGGGI